MPNAAHARQNRQSVLFSTEKGRQVQNGESSLQLFHAKDLAIKSRSSRSLEFAQCLDVACPRKAMGSGCGEARAYLVEAER
jgi:hypothetical protein